MKTQQIILLFCISILNFSCKNKTQNTSQYPIHIDFGNHVDKYKEIPLSQIADSVSYVKLENRPECFVDNLSKVLLSDQFIFTFTRKAVLQFDKKGKFIRQIGKKGKGPEEYNRVMDLYIDKTSRKLFVNAGSKIQIYDFDGKYIGYHKYFFNEFFTYLDTNTIVSATANYNGQQKNLLLFTNPQLDTLGKHPNTHFFKHPTSIYMVQSDFKRNFYTFKNQLYFVPTYNDTIFHLKDPKHLLPKFIVDKGKYKLPLKYRLECIADYEKFFLKAKDYYLTFTDELDDYVLISYVHANYAGKTKLAIYNKKTGETYSLGKSKNQASGFSNDIDGFGTFVHHSIQDDKYMVTFYEASQLIETKKELVKQQSNSEKKIQLSASYQKLMNTISEEDNLVVQIVYLK